MAPSDVADDPSTQRRLEVKVWWVAPSGTISRLRPLSRQYVNILASNRMPRCWAVD
ncbi:hypothetical protein RBSH_00918 [Rhodopirellula baltica SH28]|uniref:Uncharacterized protein n=1 Tax=Rhodopirellula baltica SH28 TaxID=993517 RepID=K5DLQ2_RHOBT|nr:hypothetical protein RBSH_00918 [Rhodopirellula baltica SH28]